MTEGIQVSGAAVFAQGILSFLAPCVLPLIPLYMGYLSGGTLKMTDGELSFSRKKVTVNTICFIIGISFVFMMLGLGATQLSRFLTGHRVLINIIGGVMLVAFGMVQLLVYGRNTEKDSDKTRNSGNTLGMFSREYRLPVNAAKMTMSPVTAFIMGITFSFAWTPCIGPVLSGVLVMTAASETQVQGFALIGLYTLGFILPFLALGLFTATGLNLLKRHMNIVRYTIIAGAVLMMIMGVLMISGRFSYISGILAGM